MRWTYPHGNFWTLSETLTPYTDIVSHVYILYHEYPNNTRKLHFQACVWLWMTNLRHSKCYTSHIVCTESLLRPRVWQAFCEHSLKGREQNLGSQSKPAPIPQSTRDLGKTSLSVLITVTDQNDGYQVIISWPRFSLQTTAHSFLTICWKWNLPPTHLLPFKICEFCNFVKKKSYSRISEKHVPSPLSI